MAFNYSVPVQVSQKILRQIICKVFYVHVHLPGEDFQLQMEHATLCKRFCLCCTISLQDSPAPAARLLCASPCVMVHVPMWVAEKAWNRQRHLFCTVGAVSCRRPLTYDQAEPGASQKNWWHQLCFFSSGNLHGHWSSALRAHHLEAGLRIPERVRGSSPAELQPWVLPGGPQAHAVPGWRDLERRLREAAV